MNIRTQRVVSLRRFGGVEHLEVVDEAGGLDGKIVLCP
jgi:hypothetical protein